MNLDLGKKQDLTVKPANPSKKEKAKVYYPTIHLSDVEGLEDLPEGEFEFEGKGRVVSKTVSERDGKRYCSCEIEVQSIECEDCADEEPTIEDAFDKVAAKKTSKTVTQDEETDEEE